MRPESVKPQTKEETDIRRRFHALAVLKGMTMREAVFKAMEFYVLKNKEVK